MEAKEFKDLVGNKFFFVKFKKKDGSIREMNARLNVRKYVKGTGRSMKEGLILLMDRKVFRENLKAGMPRKQAGARAYRSLYPESIISVKVNGKEYE